MSDEVNPYTPPEAKPGEARAKKKKKKEPAPAPAPAPATTSIAEALERLNEHIDDRSKVERDRKEVGSRLRIATMVLVFFGGTAVLGMLAGILRGAPMRGEGFVLSLAFTSIFAVLGGALLAVDLSIAPRSRVVGADVMLKSFLRAMAVGREGYAWSCLSPTARSQTVRQPSLGEFPVGPGDFSLATPTGVKDYASTFLRVGHGYIRNTKVKRASIVREDGDVAVVEIHAALQAWSQWANVIAALGVVVIRPWGALLFPVLYLALQKRHEITFRKTLLRGKNGLWYVYAGDLFENQASS
ncbi:hypothetical protein [Polyangium jinanense]|uniref:Transmembrane protein n=1 Tax=Polyangium jinanense TaxID=2829994 RepID=A0A9X3XGV0_9BACT|nr:hypothetical protein [Polyangium jinanense]MDC3962758.1 hypothetical protein [Polyangium jinanense]MDC3989265.1 hypothetical protein [Polyangium jinanense]